MLYTLAARHQDERDLSLFRPAHSRLAQRLFKPVSACAHAMAAFSLFRLHSGRLDLRVSAHLYVKSQTLTLALVLYRYPEEITGDKKPTLPLLQCLSRLLLALR